MTIETLLTRIPPRWPTIEGPFLKGQTAFWRAERGGVRLLFVGSGPTPERVEREEMFARVAPDAAGAGTAVAWAKQIHSDRALVASPGCAGEGDALIAPRDAGLALTLSTADCVPVLLAGPTHLGAAHAGWRGLANGVLAATIARIPDPPETINAWIGPSIGPCCYEVSPEVANEVARGSGAGNVAIARLGPLGKPHLDLFAAAERQLRALGVRRISTLRHCTRCDAENLHSYRREGKGAGRNLSFVYVESGR